MKKDSRKKAEKPDERKPLTVQSVTLKRSEINLNFEFEQEKRYCAFGVNREYLPKLKSRRDLLVLTAIQEPSRGEPVIVLHIETETYLCGTIEKDDFTNIYFFKTAADENAFPMMLDELRFYGEIVGFCLLNSEFGTIQKEIDFENYAEAVK